MREIESAFLDSSVANEHNQLLPATSDYFGLDGPGPYTHTPTSADSLLKGSYRRSNGDEESKSSPKFTKKLIADSETDDYM